MKREERCRSECKKKQTIRSHHEKRVRRRKSKKTQTACGIGGRRRGGVKGGLVENNSSIEEHEWRGERTKKTVENARGGSLRLTERDLTLVAVK